MEYDEITAVSPWIDFALDCGVELDEEQIDSDGRCLRPRLWKSHQRLAAINRGCKYIVTLREPAAIATSYYYFYEQKGLTRGLSLEEWVAEWAVQGTWAEPLWNYAVDYWHRRHDPAVLVVCFEEMHANPLKHIERIAEFIGIDCDEMLAERVLSMSSLDFMERHADKFDDHWLTQSQIQSGSFGEFPHRPASKVSLPQKARLSASARASLERAWQEHVTPSTGCTSYSDMRSHFCL